MKSILGYLLTVLAFAFLGSAILFGLSYWMETALIQQWVADSTDVIKSDRQLKSIALACVVRLVLCPVSSLFVPKRYLHYKAFGYVGLFFCASLLTNMVVWSVLCRMQLISDKDPFFTYMAVSGGADPGFVELQSILLAAVLTAPVFWWRRRAQNT